MLSKTRFNSIFTASLIVLGSCSSTTTRTSSDFSGPQEYKGFVLKDMYEPLSGLKVLEYEHKASGLKVLLHSKPEIKSLAYITAYNVGSRFEVKGKTGLAHLFEHMMFRGTPSFAEPFKTLSGWGDQFNAYTSNDITLYHELTPYERFDEVAKFESERMRQLKITEEGFNTERGAVVSERKMRTEDSAVGRLWWELYQLSYDKHPYQTGPIGWQEDLDATTYKDALDFYKRFYAPNRAVISLVGPFKNAEEPLNVLNKYYGSFKKEEWTEPSVPQESVRRASRRQVLNMQTELVHFAEARTSFKIGDPKSPAEVVLCRLLTDSQIGYLQQELVEKKIARSVSSNCGPDVDPGLAVVFIVANPGVSIEKIEASYSKAMSGFGAWISQKKLEGAKLFYVGEHLSSLRDVADLAEDFARSSTLAGDPMDTFKYMKALEKVSLQDVKALLKEWQSMSTTRVILKPAAKSAPFKRRVVKN